MYGQPLPSGLSLCRLRNSYGTTAVHAESRACNFPQNSTVAFAYTLGPRRLFNSIGGSAPSSQLIVTLAWPSGGGVYGAPFRKAAQHRYSMLPDSPFVYRGFRGLPICVGSVCSESSVFRRSLLLMIASCRSSTMISPPSRQAIPRHPQHPTSSQRSETPVPALAA